MSAIWMRLGIWVRRNGLRLVVGGMAVGIIAGAATGIVAGTVRTASAPDRYTVRSGGDPDLSITQQMGRPLTERIAQLDGVESTKSFVFVFAFLVAPTDGSLIFDPNPFAGDADNLGARIVAGRFPDLDNPGEFVVNRSLWEMLNETYGTQIGDVFSVRSFAQEQVTASFDLRSDSKGPTFSSMLVGVTESSTEYDDSSQQVVFSPALLDVHRDIGVVQSLISVHLRDGIAPGTVMESVRAMPNGGDAFAAPVRIVSSSARRAVTFQASALWMVSALTLVAAAAVVAQVASRTLRIADTERRSLLALGWRNSDIAIEQSIKALVLSAVAAPITVLVAYAISGMFPVGVLRLFEPDLGLRMDWTVVSAGVAAFTCVVVGTAVIVGGRRDRVGAARPSTALAGVFAARGAGVPLSVGSRFATSGIRGRGTWGSLILGAVAVAGLVGAVIVGVSLTHIVERPARWGVDYDALFGNPYTYAAGDVITPIADSPDVEAVTGINIGSVTIDGADVATIGFEQIKGSIGPIVIDGRLPLSVGEIGIGAEVERRLGVGIGDVVDVAGSDGASVPFKVVGTVVNPDSAGNGAAMIFDSFVALNPTATQNVALVDFLDGAPPGAANAVEDITFTPPDALVTPTSIRALERVTSAPYLLAVVLGVLLIVGCGYMLTTSDRARNRDLSVLRALGCDGRQLRAIVHWQATFVAAIILVVGLPLGVVAGRAIVAVLTDALGIVPGVDVPPTVISTVAVAAVLGANALALLPAQRAAVSKISGLTDQP